MKKSDLQFGALLVPLDYLMIVTAGLAAYALRFSSFYTEHIREATVTIVFPAYLKLVLVVALGWLLVFALAGLYNLRTYRKIWDEIAKVIMACSTGILAVVIFIFLNRELFASRFIVLAAWVMAIISVSLARLLAREIQRKALQKGKGMHNVIVVGETVVARNLAHLFNIQPGHGLKIVHVFSDFTKDKALLLTELVQSERIDEILLADPDLPKEERYRLIDSVNEHHLGFKYTADMLGLTRINTETFTLAGIPIVEVKKTPLDGWGRIIKRIFDIVVSGLGIILLSPVYLLTALLIKLDSKGPVFFSRLDDGRLVQRVGQNGRLFGYFKFRSMRPRTDSMRYQELAGLDERQDGPMVKIKNDPRVTRVGRFIRRWSIDELPELFLVLAGKLSLVGPRPHLPEEVARYQKHHKRLLDIKPGVTGMAQVSGRSDLPFEDEVRLDVYYIENWSLWLDLKILLQTPRAVLASRKAE